MTAGMIDGDARRQIADDLDHNLMVVAGAGTGKTTALVGRIMALLRSGAVSLGEIAAITFTEAAAAELRHRVRLAVDAAAAEGDEHMAAARLEVDDGAIGTLHAFAQRILLEHCVDAGLPPGFAVLDDTAEAADFDRRWTQFADSLLDDPEAEWALVLGFSLGLRPTDLADVAWNLHGHWDRLEDGGLEYLRAARGCDRHWPLTDAGPVIDALDRAMATIRWCTDGDDKMALHLGGPVTDAHALLTATGHDTLAVLQLLDTLPSFRCAHGRQENWTGHIAEVRAACAEAEQTRLDVLDELRRAVLGDLVARVATFTMSAAEQRRTEGRLTFHDLLVHTRRLLRGGGDGVDALRRRYRRILIDEFQDTDPIQVELAARLTSAEDGEVDMGGARSGALFVVGDPTQSIYRFRRADIDLFERVRADIGSTVVLQTNFRSQPAIVAFINVVFGAVLGHGAIPGQARHHALLAGRPGATTGTAAGQPVPPGAAPVQLSFDGIDPSDIPAPSRRRGGRGFVRAPVPSTPAPVVVVGGALAVSTPEVRRRAATDAAAAIAHILSDRWPVHDGEEHTRRPARWRDIAVLIPARSSLAAVEEAFEEAGVPYRLEGAALLWGAQEVQDVLAVLRAADDPADAVAVLGALRSPGLACGDDDLVTWHTAGGTWDPRGEPPPALPGQPVAEAMAVLDRLHRQRWWAEPSAMVGAACRELRSFELALAHRRPRDYWHRLRWLQDQARLFDETAGGTLRAFLAWAEQRVAGDGRVGGVGPPDPDDDAVRVMTIHGAKGLEFPIVVLAGLERDPSDGPAPPAVLWTEHHIPEVHVGRFRTAGYEQAGLREQHLDRLEQHRLLYVGMTRARDHLVVCLHHKQRNGVSDASLAALVTQICADNRTLWRPLPDAVVTNGAAPGAGHPRDDRGQPSTGPRADAAPEAVALPAWWEADRLRLLAALRRRPVTTATAVAGGLPLTTVTGPRAGVVPDDPGWPRPPAIEGEDPDGARRVGRAVHVALAAIDLTTASDAEGTTADEVARMAAVTQGVSLQAATVVTMVRAALASPTVAHWPWRRHWREVPVTVPVGDGGVLEGYVDLLLEDEDGLVVVDYKTARIEGDPGRCAPMAADRLQVAAYALALESSTGLPVHRCVLVFAGTDPPCEHVLQGHDLAAAVDEARRVAEALVTS